MADEPKDGGPAFPVAPMLSYLKHFPVGVGGSDKDDDTASFDAFYEEGPDGEPYAPTGITVRDYFAAKAMAAIVSAAKSDSSVARVREGLAEAAYLIADAMLAEKDRKR